MVNNELFLEVQKKGIPKFLPGSIDYRQWWKEQIYRCKYGYSVAGKYMPGRLYFHLNFFTIETNIDGSKRKKKAFPFLRDIDWDLFNTLDLCKGFSGLSSTGIPEFKNSVKGLMLITGRDSGKSTIGSSTVSYEYTFFPDNEILVSASEMKYITPTMGKVRVGLDNMPGSTEYMEEYYPSPISHQRLKDQWDVEVRSGYKDNTTGLTKGFNSRILIRTYNDNPTAANGLRVSFQLMEEVGMFSNLLDSYNSSIPCWMDGAEQFGFPLLIGTGGDMDRGSIDASRMFYQPEVHNLMAFDDTFDNTGSKIGYFIPAYMGMRQFKNDQGITNVQQGLTSLMKRREDKKKDKVTYDKELQYYPFTPKEAFLVTTGNIFPRALIEDQISYLLASKAAEHLGQKGDLKWNTDGTLDWKPDSTLFEVSYPHDPNRDRLEGCITIYEHPQFSEETERVPFGLYIGGLDPYDQDTSTTDSLGSLMIFKRFWKVGKSYDMLVCEYTARPEKSNDFYETVRKILTYYNAKVLYENMLKGFFVYAEQRKFLYLLAEQPSILKDITPNSKVNRSYGIHMDKNVKNYAINRINEYLRTEFEPGKFNVQKIFSVNLLKEMIYYNDKGNFDRIISFGLALLYNESVYKNEVQKGIELEKDLTFERFFVNHGLSYRQAIPGNRDPGMQIPTGW